MKIKQWAFIHVKKLLMAIFLTCLSFPINADSNKGELRLEVSGFDSNVGMAMIALCINEEQYQSDDKSFIETGLMIEKGRAIWQISNLPDGEYAIKLYHDENNNGKLDTNFFGIPKEAIGFSNNAVPSIGMPSFQKVKFTIRGGMVKQSIKLTRI